MYLSSISIFLLSLSYRVFVHFPYLGIIVEVRCEPQPKLYQREASPEVDASLFLSLLKDVAERSLFERSELRFVCSVAEDVKTFLNWMRRHDEAIYKKELLFIGGRYMKLSRLINSK